MPREISHSEAIEFTPTPIFRMFKTLIEQNQVFNDKNQTFNGSISNIFGNDLFLKKCSVGIFRKGIRKEFSLSGAYFCILIMDEFPTCFLFFKNKQEIGG